MRHKKSTPKATGSRAGGNVVTKGVVLETIATSVTILSAAGGLSMVFEMVKLWMGARKDQRIRLKKGDFELELQGSMSDKEIKKKIELFLELASDTKSDKVKIIRPSR